MTRNGPFPSHLLVAYLDDEPGALDRVAAIFRRRALTLHSLTLTPASEPGCSRVTLEVDAEAATFARARASLEKLVCVRRVEAVRSHDHAAAGIQTASF